MTMTEQTPATTAQTPALRLTNVSKSFGAVHAVKDVTLEIPRHEVVGLIGENGAGKSTLLKILTGLHQPDSGEIEANGVLTSFRRPQDATAAGIGVVHQEQSLLTNMSVAENIAMNAMSSAEPATKLGIYRWGRLNREAKEVLERVGADNIDPRTIVSDLSFVDRQMVEIARALRVDELAHTSPLVILDEPTSVLERNETEVLEREIRLLKKVGSVIFVSHRLDEVLRICDRIVVMRHGAVVADRSTDEVSEDELFRLMIGHAQKAAPRPATERTSERPALRVQGLTRKGAFKDVSFDVEPGRCTAIVGTLGSGREPLSRAIFGAEPFDSGTIEVDGKPVRAWSVAKAVRHHIGYVPAERKVEGMVGGMDAAENLTLVHPGRSRRGPLLRRRARAAIAQEWFGRLDVRPNNPRLDLARFSGGNQQKVVMAKWLNAESLKVLVLDHPLRGLDPGASETVNAQIRVACERGAAVVLLPDTLEEALEMGDEVIVMRDGDVTARFDLTTESPSSLDLLERMV